MVSLVRSVRKNGVIFSAKIEYPYEYEKNGIFLRPKFSEFDKKILNYELPQYEKIESTIKEIILTKFPSHMEKVFGTKFSTNILSVEPGSIIVFFSVLLTGYTLISNYKGFYDSIKLIEKQADRILKNGLFEKFNIDFRVDTNIETPSLPNPYESRKFKELRHFILNHEDILSDVPKKRRDGFFYYLLISNIVLLIIIGFLIYGAVISTYF